MTQFAFSDIIYPMQKENLEKLNKIKDNYGNPYSLTNFAKESSISALKADFSEEKEVATAGRLMTKREHGKSIFFDIRDSSDKIQAYLRKDKIDSGQYELFKLSDIGDIAGIKGKLFKTRTGEITVLVETFRLLSKSLHPLPEKWHGLKDIEIRFRKRYLDLIMNPDTTAVFTKRAQIIKSIRGFFDKLEFTEVETPMLHSVPSGAAGRPFKTHHNALDMDIYLRIAPELYLKKLLVGNLDKVYEINRSFRNEGISPRHNPEFTMLEVYAAYKDYSYMMELTEALIKGLVKILYGTLSITHQNKAIDFSKKFNVFSLAGQLEKDYGIMPDDGRQTFIEKMSKHLDIKTGLSRSQIVKLIEDIIEEKYFGTEPVFVTDFYRWMSPLAKTKKDSPNLVERFELFIGGIEIANAYSELNDPVEQKERLLESLAEQDELPKQIDQDFIEALEHGMPPAAGLGIGIDRLIMILLNQASLKEVILFPLMKPRETKS